MNRRNFLIASVAAGIPTPVMAKGNAVALTGTSFMIGGREHKLADIASPSGADFSTAFYYAEQSESVLQSILDEGIDEVRQVSAPDRWGRQIVVPSKILDLSGKITFQHLLIVSGAAWVEPQSDDYEFILRLLQDEERARRSSAGVWVEPFYQKRSSEEAATAIGYYRIIEGIVVSASARRDYTYLNFGEDYKTDFTATVRSSLARKWKEQGYDLLAYEGEQVRVRGYVEWINGPSISLTHPLQVERLLRQT